MGEDEIVQAVGDFGVACQSICDEVDRELSERVARFDREFVEQRSGALPVDECQGSVFPAGRAELVERPDDAGPTEIDVVRILVLVAVARVPCACSLRS